MVRGRMIPLVVAFALAFAPVALEACQVTCLSHDAETVAGSPVHHHHSHGAPVAAAMPAAHVHHHHTATPSPVLPVSSAVMTALPNPCDHGDELPTIAAALNSVLVGPAVTASSLFLPERHPRTVRDRETTPSASSEPITLTTQLRV